MNLNQKRDFSRRSRRLKAKDIWLYKLITSYKLQAFDIDNTALCLIHCNLSVVTVNLGCKQQSSTNFGHCARRIWFFHEKAVEAKWLLRVRLDQNLRLDKWTSTRHQQKFWPRKRQILCGCSTILGTKHSKWKISVTEPAGQWCRRLVPLWICSPEQKWISNQ